jgi:flavin reductase (DIM6/NTAB) family NADH-FMN oxidoreductase RutF
MTDPMPTLGRIPSGIFILTIGRNAQATGMLASWVMQAGFDPPCVTVAVKRGRYVAEWLGAGEPFVLNLVGEKQHQHLKHFGKGFEPGEPAFEGVDVETASNGVPALREVVGRLECLPASHVESGDHVVFLATVTGGELSFAELPPMVHIRKSGAHY